MKRLILSAGITFLLTVGPVWAGPFEDATTAYVRGDYATAMKTFRWLAVQGYAPAQYELGKMYESGRGVPQDYGKARQWYKLAAEQGDAKAQYKLGELYVTGWGDVPQDYVKARQWYEQAAKQGHAEAQDELGKWFSGNSAVPTGELLEIRDWWFSLIPSDFVLIGRNPDYGSTYSGTAVIKGDGTGFTLERTIGEKRITARGTIEIPHDHEGGKFLVFRWKDKINHLMACLVDVDPNNFARLTCVWWLGDRDYTTDATPGLESYFPTEPWFKDRDASNQPVHPTP